MSFVDKRSTFAIVTDALISVIDPPPPMAPAAWAGENFKLPDGEFAGKFIVLERTPHLIEPLNALGPDEPDNLVAVMKCGQSAFTTLLQMAIGHSIDRDPCDMMVVQPTDTALTDFNSQKLGRAIESSPVLQRKVRPQVARAGTGSTTYEKKFAGGALFLALASSSADLRSKTIKKAFCDEIDEYEDDLNGQGDPLDMIEARQTSFLRSGTWKRLLISTPTLKGASKIERVFLGGDQRHWTMMCPQCGDRNLRFEEGGENFRYNSEPPYRAHYVAPCCGGVIDGWQKNEVYLTGRWEPAKPGAAYKSYFFGGLSSPFVPFDYVARKLIEAGTDPAKQKTVWNLTLGLPYEMKGDVPDFEMLLARREVDLKRGQIPPRGLVVTAFVDVQMRGLWYEILAHAPNRERWVVDAGYIDGDTSDPDGEVFDVMRRLTLDHQFPDAFGSTRTIDAIGIDSGYRSHVVYSVVRRLQRMHPMSGRDLVLATKGLKGWNRPALGQPTLVDVDLGGKRIQQGARVWGIGTWALKATHYSMLRIERAKDSAVYPDGYCHHGAWLDEVYFKQLTAEQLVETKVRGHVTGRRWEPGGNPNHFLDCRVGNLALAEYLGMSSTTPEQWAKLAAIRGLPPELSTVDLFTPHRASAEEKAPAPAPAADSEGSAAPRAASEQAAPARRSWLPTTRGWLQR